MRKICEGEGVAGAVPVPFSVWKELSQLQGSVPAPCSTGPREPIRIRLLGAGPAKTGEEEEGGKDGSLSTLPSSPLF